MGSFLLGHPHPAYIQVRAYYLVLFSHLVCVGYSVLPIIVNGKYLINVDTVVTVIVTVSKVFILRFLLKDRKRITESLHIFSEAPVE